MCTEELVLFASSVGVADTKRAWTPPLGRSQHQATRHRQEDEFAKRGIVCAKGLALAAPSVGAAEATWAGSPNVGRALPRKELAGWREPVRVGSSRSGRTSTTWHRSDPTYQHGGDPAPSRRLIARAWALTDHRCGQRRNQRARQCLFFEDEDQCNDRTLASFLVRNCIKGVPVL